MSSQPTHVEIKISLGAADVSSACARFGLDQDDSSPYELYFCDIVTPGPASPSLALFDRGLIVRLRSRRNEDDTTIKYRRPKVDLPRNWDRNLGDVETKVEGDWTGETRQVSASMTLPLDPGVTITAVRRAPALDTALFRRPQEKFLREVGDVDRGVLPTLQPLGPVHASKWDRVPGLDFDKDVIAERWATGPLEFLELSIRVKFDRAEEWQRRFMSRVADEGFDVGAMATTKTQTILTFLAGQ